MANSFRSSDAVNLSISVSDSLGFSDKSVLERIENGESVMPLEPMLRAASLLARHDPIPFVIKFMRTEQAAGAPSSSSSAVVAGRSRKKSKSTRTRMPTKKRAGRT